MWIIALLIASECYMELDGGEKITLDFCDAPPAQVTPSPANNPAPSPSPSESTNFGNCVLTSEKYQILLQENQKRQASSLQANYRPLTPFDFNRILGCSGQLIDNKQNTQWYQWRDQDEAHKIVRGTFRDGKLINFSAQGL